MNKNILWLIVGFLVVVLLILTNPKDVDHKAAVKSKMNEIVQAQLQATSSDGNRNAFGIGQNIGTLLGSLMLDRIVDTGVSRTNYILFSTTNFTYGGEPKTIGVGLLGNVYLSQKVDDAVKETTGKMLEK